MFNNAIEQCENVLRSKLHNIFINPTNTFLQNRMYAFITKHHLHHVICSNFVVSYPWLNRGVRSLMATVLLFRP